MAGVFSGNFCPNRATALQAAKYCKVTSDISQIVLVRLIKKKKKSNHLLTDNILEEQEMLQFEDNLLTTNQVNISQFIRQKATTKK